MNSKSLLYLWKERTLYLGRLDEPLNLLQGAATLCLSLEGALLVKFPDQDRVVETSAVLLPPGCSVYIDTRNQLIANLNLDVMGSDYFSLGSNMQSKAGEVYVGLVNDSIKHVFSDIHHHAYASSEARQLLYGFLREQAKTEFFRDSRVQKVVDSIQDSIDHNLPIELLADSVSLSTPRLVKLFKQQTGVPIRRYRQWHRLFVTASQIGEGKNLTEAALAAGFVDLSHCTNTFHQMLGVRPSYFLQRPEDILVITEAA